MNQPLASSVSIVEGKKNFSRIIHAAEESKRETILTRHGKPVAVIIPFEAYIDNRKADAYRRIMEVRAVYGNAKIDARSVIEEARAQLRKRP